MAMHDPVRQLLALGDDPAMVFRGLRLSYADLHALVQAQDAFLNEHGLTPGSVVALRGDFSPLTIALLLALFEQRAVVALIPAGPADAEALCAQVGARALIEVNDEMATCRLLTPRGPHHPLLAGLLQEEKAGFVIFTSGSSGTPKPVLHGLDRFLKKYRTGGKAFSTLSFLLLDHIAGLDTLFYILYSGGVLVAPQERSPDHICRLIESAKVQVLPVSPSFVNLLWLSGDFERYDLSSVEIVTCGSEPMNANVLDHVAIMFPNATIKQKYGTSEFGSPASQSRGDDQRWIRLDGAGFETKVVDGILYVKSETTMLGYLDDSAPAVVDGWTNTGDRVEQDGPWLRILGRDSDIINVGGEKVFPGEVESVIGQVDEVAECLVYGEPNPITGSMVCATVLPRGDVDQKALRKAIKKLCGARMSRYKVPVKITFSEDSLTNARQKKVRRAAGQAPGGG